MSAARQTRRLSAVLADWAEIDAALVRQTGMTYDQSHPGWYAEEGLGLDAALAYLDRHPQQLTETERSRLAWFRERAEVPGSRAAATAIIVALHRTARQRAEALETDPQPWT